MINHNIKDEDINQRVEQTVTALDQQRLRGLETLKRLQNNQNFGLEKERDRLTQKYGENHPRVQAIANRITYNQQFFPALEREIERTQVKVPPIDEKTWRIHGRVLNQDNGGIPELTVALRDEHDRWVRPLGYTCTNELGYFAITYTFAPNQKPPVAETQPLILAVSNRDRQTIHRETRPTYLKPGISDERLIILENVAPPCDLPPCDRKDDDGNNGNDDVPPSNPPTITRVKTNAKHPTVYTPVQLSADVEGDSPLTYHWSFGDGNTSTEATPIHRYTEAKLYRITLAVTNQAGTASRSVQLSVNRLSPDTWVVYGQIVNEADQPQANLTVKLYDQDHVYDDLLGNTTTDAQGYFTFYYQTRDFQDLFERQPDLYLEVYDRKQQLIYSSENSVHCQAGRAEVFNIRLQGG